MGTAYRPCIAEVIWNARAAKMASLMHGQVCTQKTSSLASGRSPSLNPNQSINETKDGGRIRRGVGSLAYQVFPNVLLPLVSASL